jgi:glucose-1-phosphate adenylyltransferase
MDWYRGNADAVYQNLSYLRERDTEIALIVSGDHIYSMDYRELILEHLERGADLTLAFKRMPEPDRRFGYGVLDASGKLIDYAEKPAIPPSDLASLTIYVFNLEPLEEILTAFKDHDSIEFGRDVIPAMMSRYRVFGHVFDGYWAYTRTVDAYYEAHQDLLEGKIDIESWLVRTNNQDNGLVRQVPPIFRHWTRAEGSLIGEGSIVDGTVVDSVLGPGVRVARGAVVEGSILFNDVVVEAGAEVHRAIVDKRARVGRDARLGRDAAPTERAGAAVSARGIVLLGKGARVDPQARVPAGGLVPPRGRWTAGGAP